MSSVALFANSPASLGNAEGQRLPGPLETEIRRIYELSPLYAQRFPLHSEPLHWGCYLEIPVLSKEEIFERSHQAFFADYRDVEKGLEENRFEYENTGGSTAKPMTVIMEEGWWDAQATRAYLASPILRQFAGKAHRRCILAPVGCSSHLCPYTDRPFPNRYHNGTVFLNLTSDPFAFTATEWDRVARELQAVKPDLLEGEPTYLSLLAKELRQRNISLPSLKAVILTYGASSLRHRRTIARQFPIPQVDLYGSTEAGYLLVGTPGEPLQPVEDNAFLELLPHPGAPDVFELSVTTRGRQAMPLLRYRTGDLVRRKPDGLQLLGRSGSVFARADGRLISSADVDAALPDSFDCWHHALIQTGPQRWDFLYVAERAADAKAIETALGQLLGEGQRVAVMRRRSVPPSPSGKFVLFKPL